MTTIILQTSAQRVEVPAQTTLTALEEANLLDIPFGCHDGHCAACMIQVVSGAECLNAPVPVEHYTLTSAELEQGVRLACRTTIISDEGTVKLRVYY